VSSIPQLVQIFANHRIASIASNPQLLEQGFGNVSLGELNQRQGFPEERELVEEMKKIVERMEQDNTIDFTIPKAQVSQSLRAIFRFVRYQTGSAATVELKVNTLRDLIVARYTPTGTEWTAEQREHFDFVFERLKSWNTYFLSYTNEGGHILNSVFKDVVDLYTEPDVLAARDRAKHNILADTIVNALRKRLGARGSFFDKKDIKVGMGLDPTITTAVTRTFAFVQIIQLETFDSTRPVNWTWKEYSLFDTSNEAELKNCERYRQVFAERFAPVLTMAKGKFKKQLPDVSWDFDLWYQRIFSAKFLELPVSTQSFDDIMGELSDGIVSLTCRIIDNVP
jgi:hypothetical protein